MGRSFYLGVIVGSIVLALTLASRLTFHTIFIPELAVDALIANIPGWLESAAINALGFYAKYLAFIIATIVAVVTYGTLAIFFYSRVKGASRIGSGVIFGVVVSVIVSVVLVPLTVRTRGTDFTYDIAWILIPNLLYGAGLDLCRRKMRPLSAREPRIAKRIFIKKGVIGLTGLVLFAFLIDRFFLRSMMEQPEPIPAGRAGVVRRAADVFKMPELMDLVANEVTPNSKFYVVSKNVFDPSVDGNGWTLTVDGLVEKPLRFTYEEFTSLPSKKQSATLICISNPIGGDLISNAEWVGVPMNYILKMAGVKPNGKEVVFYCADGYTDSIPIEKAWHQDTILAYRMNGETLPKSHGFPIRAIIPGLYGMKNPKWITRLELVDYDFRGYWETRGWSKEAAIHTMSRVDLPTLGARIRGVTPVAGIAFAGDRGVEKVQVSVDGGVTWQDALTKDPTSRYSWVLWAGEWEPQEPGTHSIRVRAIDKTGKIQEVRASSTYPAGATGYHVIHVAVGPEERRPGS